MNIVENTVLDCGWGKLMFGETFIKTEKLATELKKERKKERNIVFYPLDPQILLTRYPQEFFLNPAYTYKIDLQSFPLRRGKQSSFSIRKLQTIEDLEQLNTVYEKMKMQPLRMSWFEEKKEGISIFLVINNANDQVLGGVMTLDHYVIFKDPKKSCSIWSLVVDSDAPYAGIGKSLVKYVIAEYKKKKRERLFLSVVSENIPAQRLYESLGFVRTPILTVKNKTPINENLFVSQDFAETFSPHVQGIVKEALKRGIYVQRVQGDVFRLTLGGREILCHESLSEMTNAVSQEYCYNQKMFLNMLEELKIEFPDTLFCSRFGKAKECLDAYGSIILKTPIKNLVSEEIQTQMGLKKNFARLHTGSSEIVVQEHKKGDLYRLLVIDGQVISVVRSEIPTILGNGKLSIRQLIKKQSRRKIALSGGESKIPLDSRTRGVISSQGYGLDDILKKDERLELRNSANYHTGGTMTEVTDSIPAVFKKIATKISKKLNVSVIDIEMIIPDLERTEYYVLEASSKPHLSYYGSSKVYARFIDSLFPRSK